MISTDSASIYHSFQQVGTYVVSVNITNGVSVKGNEIEVICLDRVGTISFEVIDGYQGAAANGKEVIIAVGAFDIINFWCSV